jgi:predicted ABC-type ATPase
MKTTHDKKIFMIAGPNGAGKTTTALVIQPDLMDIYEFINADEIAFGLAPLHPESVTLTASKLMIKRLQELLQANKSFSFETTAAGTNYVKYLKQARAKGYEISLLFLWLPNADLAVERVAKRVEQGGHFIPEDTVRRRYILGIKNLLKHYLPLAHRIVVLDNSVSGSQKFIASKSLNGSLKILDKSIWKEMERIAYA